MSQIRVSIFSDDPFFREGLRQLVRSEPGFTIIDGDLPVRDGIGGTGDVQLVDSRTEGVLDHCAGLKADRPLLIFLSVPNDAWAVDALSAGARGVIRKEDAITDLVRAVRVVAGGGVWAPRRIVVDAWLRQRRGAAPDARALVFEQRLSAREREVARCVAAGMSNKDLADRLDISPATVKAHLTHIFQKVGVHGRGELTAAYHGTLTAEARRRDSVRLRRLA